MTPAYDEKPVEALLTQRADEALGVGIGVWCPDRRVYQLYPLGLKDLVARCAELRIAIVDQEAHRSLQSAALNHEVARLLSCPRPARILGRAREVDSARV